MSEESGFDYDAAKKAALDAIASAHKEAGHSFTSTKRANFESSIAVAASYGETSWIAMAERALGHAGVSHAWPIGADKVEIAPGKGRLTLT